MNSSIKVDGVMVLTGAAIVTAIIIALKVKGTFKDVAQAIDKYNPVSSTGITSWMPNAGQGSVGFSQALPGVTSKDYQSVLAKNNQVLNGSVYSQPNASAMGSGVTNDSLDLMKWLQGSLVDVSPWYAGYQMDDWEIENPFSAEPDKSNDNFLYSADSPIGKAVSYVESLFSGKYSDIINDGVQGDW